MGNNAGQRGFETIILGDWTKLSSLTIIKQIKGKILDNIGVFNFVCGKFHKEWNLRW